MLKKLSSERRAHFALIIGLVSIGFSAIFIALADAPGTVSAFFRMAIATVLVGLPFLHHTRSQGKSLPRLGIRYAVLGGLLFAALGMICTALVPGIETFNLPIFLGITPMFLFSGTFFPLQNLPGWAQNIAQLLPLTHLVALVRGCSLQIWSGDLWLSLIYLLVAAFLLLPLAIALMVRRIVV